jgi:pimeloyl-ACP methyl ester carboxylesterase
MALFQHGDIELYYELHGSGPPLMLIAGLASDSQSWLPVLADLKKQFSVVLMDNRGVGRSSQDCRISVELMADDCVSLLRHLGLEKVHLVGHSMGAMVALEITLRYPELVARLGLVTTAACNLARNNLMFADWADHYESGQSRAAWFRTVLAWILTEGFFENRQLVDAALIYLQAYPWPQSAAGFRRQIEAIAEFNARDRLESVSVPTCVIAAELDTLMPLHCSEELASRIPDARLVIIKAAAHSIHSEQPELLIRELFDFFDPMKGELS